MLNVPEVGGADRPIPEPSLPAQRPGMQGNAVSFEGAQKGAASLLASAQQTHTNLYSRLTNALNERGQMLGNLEDQFNSLEQGSKTMVDQVRACVFMISSLMLVGDRQKDWRQSSLQSKRRGGGCHFEGTNPNVYMYSNIMFTFKTLGEAISNGPKCSYRFLERNGSNCPYVLLRLSEERNKVTREDVSACLTSLFVQ